MSQISNLQLTLRSLFRFKLMNEKNYPDLLISLEKKILNDRMKNLSLEEVQYINCNFSKLYEEYLVESEIDDIIFTEQVNQKMEFLN